MFLFKVKPAHDVMIFRIVRIYFFNKEVIGGSRADAKYSEIK